VKNKKIARLVCLTLIFLAALGIWERPISVVYFKGFIPLRLYLAGAESRSVTVENMSIHYDVLGQPAGPPRRVAGPFALSGEGRLSCLSAGPSRLRPQ